LTVAIGGFAANNVRTVSGDKLTVS